MVKFLFYLRFVTVEYLKRKFQVGEIASNLSNWGIEAGLFEFQVCLDYIIRPHLKQTNNSFLKIFKKERFFTHNPTLTTAFHFSRSPYVLFTLQQLTEHIVVPGHDGQV